VLAVLIFSEGFGFVDVITVLLGGLWSFKLVDTTLACFLSIK
jgi:hypothetical protein